MGKARLDRKKTLFSEKLDGGLESFIYRLGKTWGQH